MKPLTAWSPGFSRSKPFEPPEGGTPNQPRFMARRKLRVGERRPRLARSTRNQPPATCLTPFLRLELFLWHLEVNQHEVFGKPHQLVRTAGIKDGGRQILNVFFDPLGGDAPAPARPRVLWMQPRAGDVKVKMRIVQLQLVELIVEDDVVGRTDAVKNRDLRFQLAFRGLAHESAERRHTRSAG